MGNGNFRPPTESTPINRLPKNCCGWLRRRPLQLCQIWCTSVHGKGFSAYGWNNQILKFIYTPFSGTYLQVSRGIFANDSSNGADWREDVSCWYSSPVRGSNLPKDQILEAWIGIFKPNSRDQKHYQNYCIDFNQTLHNDKDHQMIFVGDPNTRTTNPRWRMAAILKIEKSRYLSNGLTVCHKI